MSSPCSVCSSDRVGVVHLLLNYLSSYSLELGASRIFLYSTLKDPFFPPALPNRLFKRKRCPILALTPPSPKTGLSWCLYHLLCLSWEENSGRAPRGTSGKHLKFHFLGFSAESCSSSHFRNVPDYWQWRDVALWLCPRIPLELLPVDLCLENPNPKRLFGPKLPGLGH